MSGHSSLELRCTEGGDIITCECCDCAVETEEFPREPTYHDEPPNLEPYLLCAVCSTTSIPGRVRGGADARNLVVLAEIANHLKEWIAEEIRRVVADG